MASDPLKLMREKRARERKRERKERKKYRQNEKNWEFERQWRKDQSKSDMAANPMAPRSAAKVAVGSTAAARVAPVVSAEIKRRNAKIRRNWAKGQREFEKRLVREEREKLNTEPQRRKRTIAKVNPPKVVRKQGYKKGGLVKPRGFGAAIKGW